MATATDPSELYLDLLKHALTRTLSRETYRPLRPVRGTVRYWPYRLLTTLLHRRGLAVGHRVRYHPETDTYQRIDRQDEGMSAPPEAETMIGMRGLNQLHDAVREILRSGIPGDLMETGVWRGGACIFMRGALKAYGDTSRRVWVADSFQGVPRANPNDYPADTGGDNFWQESATLAITEAEVRANFAKYRLLDDQVQFLPGWFKDTLPTAPVQQLALLRLDGDLYESTMQALTALYPKLSPGGYVIVDDYRLDGCRKAIEDYRRAHGIIAPVETPRDGFPFWRR